MTFALPTRTFPLSLHDALPISLNRPDSLNAMNRQMTRELIEACRQVEEDSAVRIGIFTGAGENADRKSTRLNSSHGYITYAVFCLIKKRTPLDSYLPDHLQHHL